MTLRAGHYHSAWTLNVLLAVGAAAVIALLAYPAAAFFDEPRLTAVMLVLCAATAVGGLENIGIVQFRRTLAFHREFLFLASRRVAASVFVIALAVMLESYWALALGMLGSKVLAVGLSYFDASVPPPFQPGAIGELMRFSGWMLASNIIWVVQTKAPHFVVGRLLGANPLGFLTIATEIAQIPASDFVAPINRALFPGYARMTSDLAVLRIALLDVSGVVMLVVVPAGIGIAAIANPLVRTALGPVWMEAVPLIQVLALASIAAAAAANLSSAYLALGIPRRLTFDLVASHGGPDSAFRPSRLPRRTHRRSICRVGGFTIYARYHSSYAAEAPRTSIQRLRRPRMAATPAAVVMGACVHATVTSMTQNSVAQSALALGVGIGTGLVLYPLSLTFLWLASGRQQGPELIVYTGIRTKLARKKNLQSGGGFM